ncbi:DUF721 domain-containing protein [Photobacterium damselae]|uniref:Zn-ribbon-containing, possibly RNA-binding protein and truncated derivatives n=1 Tax=Photobacterium damselae TaxID=38293 RepID=A0A2T3QMP9_PHODM|nr:DciA family protein [Photobacterium damselae]ARR50211.1 hypothetical protein CAY62_12265 [Photobacterium damselae subsp. damselae]EHA1081587.1 DUF721 domain-containing protein [Photobacterium damselae]KAB1177899.1 DUF721 domain-containing protein [Photobacterium damselae subsp. damselae]MBF7099497.1 DUF721 domain-containing protein [Photobacterium damselae]MCG3812982.1 DUF721 domain-containing protein [Photobacterium damselae]
MRDHRPQTAADLLDSNQLVGNIQERALALSRLNDAVKAHLNCAEHCRVSNYRQGILIIEIASAAWSMRLNYERNSLITKLREKLLPNLVDIQVKVNPNLAAVQVAKHNKTPDIVQKPISDVAASHLLQAAEHASEKVKARLERLAQLAKKNKEGSN